ncbi:molybdopterin-dependent oxidoreductase [Glaciecola sp. SC05]|uniref:nitrate reductase n=1 Tax=Glaciecola sp. SC05 TaxID=1987355 RepID=UPI003527CAE1
MSVDKPAIMQIVDTQIHTTCPYCGVGCGVDVCKQTVRRQAQDNDSPLINEHLIGLSGQVSHPANYGKLCVKGSHLLETNSPEGRLLYPSIEGNRASWTDALDTVAKKISHVVDEHGPDAVAFYLSGQLLTEDYYVANKLMKGFIGSANVDTNSRLCMSSAVAAYKRAFGADAVPCCYDDLSNTDMIVLIGSNAAWTHPVLYQRMQLAKQQNSNMKMVLIDPRSTATATECDLHLAIRPGSDTWLFNGLLNFIHANQALNQDYIKQYTEGFEQALLEAQNADLATVAKHCDIAIQALTTFYSWFVDSPSTISFYSMGINQSTSGVDKANSIINCHLASGKIGKVGSGPFSITGQPNAMGGREVGGLANMLAAHMDIHNTEHRSIVSRFWKAPNLATQTGLKAVDMFDAMAQGKIKFIWIIGTNPVVSMPNRNLIEAALIRCETVVVSDVVDKNDTLGFANIVLPASAWSEKDGTVTNSERCISRQRALVASVGESLPDWQAICEVAKRLGYREAFSYQHAGEIFCEHAALTGFENDGRRDLDLSALAQMNKTQFDKLAPVQWPINKSAPKGTPRMFTDGRFFTPSGKAQFIVTAPMAPKQVTTAQYPLILNTGRMRDHWHTMTRTGKAAKLHQHTQQPYLYVHPAEAKKYALADNDLVSLSSAQNTTERHMPIVLPIKIDSKQRSGEVFCPIHWSKTYTSHVNIAALFSSAADPISGQPELKHAAVALSPLKPLMQMVLYTRQAMEHRALAKLGDYYVITALENAFMYRLAIFSSSQVTANPQLSADSQTDTATNTMPSAMNLPPSLTKHITTLEHWTAHITQHLSSHFELLAYEQAASDSRQCMALDEGKLQFFCHASHQLATPNSDWLNDLFNQASLNPEQRNRLLQHRAEPRFTQGKQVCSCFKVHENTIVEAIQQGATTVFRLGEGLKCGTNCGSCKSELSQLIAQHKALDNNLNKIDIRVEI